MEKSKVSIVVPVYNIACWLNECMESLVSQNYRNIEILLGDDGSTDGSSALCDEWERKDDRVKVIHKTNGGAASARNVCLDEATGDYICFVDSDDVVSKAYVSHLVETLESSSADIAVCGFSYLKTSGLETVILSTRAGTYSGEGFMMQFLKDWSCALLWNKIFRREIIGTIRMDEGHRIDDEYFTYQVCLNAHTVTVTDDCLYYYRLRKSSVMNVYEAVNEKTLLDRIGYMVERYKRVSKALPCAEQAYFQDAVDTLARYYKYSKQMPEAQKQIRKWIKKHYMKLWKLPVSVKEKLAYQYIFFFSFPKYGNENTMILSDSEEYFD